MAKLPASCSDFWDAAIFDLHGLPEFLNRVRKCALLFGEEKLLGIEMPLREAIWPIVLGVEVVDFAFQPPDQNLLDAFLLAILKLAGLCEAYRIQNFEQSGETSRVAIVWGGCQKELVLKQRRDLPECLDELVVLAEGRREQIVGLIDDEKIPRQLSAWATRGGIRGAACREKLLQDVWLAQVIIGRDNARECAPRIGVQPKSPLNRMRLGAVDQIEVERELRLHLALPLLRE